MTSWEIKQSATANMNMKILCKDMNKFNKHFSGVLKGLKYVVMKLPHNVKKNIFWRCVQLIKLR